MVAAPQNLTALLRQLPSRDPEVRDRVAAAIYPQLRKIARRQLRNERAGHLLQATALVHEAYLRLAAHDDHDWKSRAHFFGAAAQAMRRILVDHARSRGAQKRDAVRLSVPPGEAAAAAEARPVELLDLDRALTELESIASRQARIVSLRYFVGLSVPEIAEALGLNPRTVDRDWAAARVWLRRRLSPA
jgi:RNA polymerase sigma factor (TIGR02999 family)